MLTANLLLVVAPLLAAGAEGLPAAESLKRFQIADGLAIELVAAEPEVVDPVAVAWDEFGRMFVVEMRDYPNGPGEGQPFLSRVKMLEDRDGDGRYETAGVFADELPYANGVLPWHGGVIVTAAPDIWFLKDTDADGKADQREKLFTGFKEGNPQLRVNHPTLGIDNWIYVANGLSGGEVRRADDEQGRAIPIPQMDFRWRPDRSEFEATAGNAQFGLAFDDYGNRFVCSNRNHAVHVVLPDRYLKRNPHLRVSKTVHDIPDHGAAARIFPLTRAVTTAVEHAGSFTAACGLTVYRGSALGDVHRGNIFVCDPTGNLVHRDVLEAAGATFVARRAEGESRREFLASTDEWFRPVNLANGPDGALYVIDMYRETIEHPQYMPKGLAETLDLRRGDDKGRIYRVTGASPRHLIGPWPGQMKLKQLVETLTHPDAWWRETAQRLLIERHDHQVVNDLYELLRHGGPATRIHALWTLAELKSLQDSELGKAMSDADPPVRVHAVRLAESRVARAKYFDISLAHQADDPDARVRLQVALALGELPVSEAQRRLGQELSPRAVALARIVQRDVEDTWAQHAVLSSSAGIAGELWQALGQGFTREPTAAKALFVTNLATLIGARRDSVDTPKFLRTFVAQDPADAWWQLAAITGLADGLRPSGGKLQDLFATLNGEGPAAATRVEQLLAQAAAMARYRDRPIAERIGAIRAMINSPFADVAQPFRELLDVAQPQQVQVAAAHALASVNDPGVAPLLLDGWASYSPPVRREVLEAVFSRRERLAQLLDAIEAGNVRAAELGTERHAQLLNHSVAEIKERAQKLFENEGTPNRKEVIESFRPVLTQAGDAERGKALFVKHCATCHRIAGDGHLVGPELSGLRTRSKEALLMDVLDPNRALSPNYASYLVATKDGRVLSGIIASETATSITLRRAEAAEDTLLRCDIEAIQATGQSLMPEGLERNMTQAEMVDLVEFLKSVP
jgi:putative membrane-bound dehydrogenase-like protein